jgi:hypothetical protein
MKDLWNVNKFYSILYAENHMIPINTLCGQNAALLIVKACGTCGYHWALKG